jgi:hypothetical protein
MKSQSNASIHDTGKQQTSEIGVVVKAFHDAIPQRAHSPQNKIGGP